jgi:GNAT superfamily N-acetyltransferase
MNVHELSVLLEKTEAAGWLGLFDEDHSCTIEDAIVSASPGLDILAYNRIIGLGTEIEISEKTVSHILDWYRMQGVPRCMLALSPYAKHLDANAMLVKTGFRPHNYWAKLYAPLVEVKLPPINPQLDLTEAGHHEAGLFAGIILQAFEWPDALAPKLLNMFHHPDYKVFLAWANGTPIAAGALYHYGPVSTMAIAGTLPAHRGHGAQKALLNKRIQYAKDLNARYIATETGKDSEEKPNLSFRNMRAIGLNLLYHRRNYVFEFDR